VTDPVQQPAVLVERRDDVLVITINRPEARNCVNGAVSIGVGDALEEAQQDADVRAVVITGAGDKSFCAGADLKAISRRENLYHPDHGEWGFAGYVHHFIDKPTIAAVNGTALGGGTELALASDLVVAEERAQFGLPEVKVGLLAGAGGVFRIAQQLPRKVGMQMLLTGEPISAAEAPVPSRVAPWASSVPPTLTLPAVIPPSKVIVPSWFSSVRASMMPVLLTTLASNAFCAPAVMSTCPPSARIRPPFEATLLSTL